MWVATSYLTCFLLPFNFLSQIQIHVCRLWKRQRRSPGTALHSSQLISDDGYLKYEPTHFHPEPSPPRLPARFPSLEYSHCFSDTFFQEMMRFSVCSQSQSPFETKSRKIFTPRRRRRFNLIDWCCVLRRQRVPSSRHFYCMFPGHSWLILDAPAERSGPEVRAD